MTYEFIKEYSRTAIENNYIFTPAANIVYTTTLKTTQKSFVAYDKLLSYRIMLRISKRNKEKNNSGNGESFFNDKYGDDKLIIKKT